MASVSTKSDIIEVQHDDIVDVQPGTSAQARAGVSNRARSAARKRKPTTIIVKDEIHNVSVFP